MKSVRVGIGVLTACLVGMTAGTAQASFIFNFDETGVASYQVCTETSDPTTCGAVQHTTGALAADGTEVGSALRYDLPAWVAAGDVVILDSNGSISDLLRFGSTGFDTPGYFFFYSADVGGGLLADTGLPAVHGDFVGATEQLDGTFSYNILFDNRYNGFSGDSSAAAVPEPTSLALLGSGLILAWRARRKFAR